MPMRTLLAVLLLGAPLLAGCLVPPEDSDIQGLAEACALPSLDVRILPMPADGVRSDPSTGFDMLVDLRTNATTPPLWSIPEHEGWDLGTLTHIEDSAAHTMLSHHARPDGPILTGSLELHARAEPAGAQCTGHTGYSTSAVLHTPASGEVAEPGQGVHVHTSGFWPNGTLFYTTMQEVHNSDWPRAGWYAFGSPDPLPVYVYDEDPSERPPFWAPAYPPQADPIADQLPAPPYGYFTTIQGFNEALKQASTTTSLVATLRPEEAYTQPGNEDHVLYGDSIIFYIEVVDVVDRPCAEPLPTTGCDLPQ